MVFLKNLFGLAVVGVVFDAEISTSFLFLNRVLFRLNAEQQILELLAPQYFLGESKDLDRWRGTWHSYKAFRLYSVIYALLLEYIFIRLLFASSFTISTLSAKDRGIGLCLFHEGYEFIKFLLNDSLFSRVR
jgi:hypothetical protein